MSSPRASPRPQRGSLRNPSSRSCGSHQARCRIRPPARASCAVRSQHAVRHRRGIRAAATCRNAQQLGHAATSHFSGRVLSQKRRLLHRSRGRSRRRAAGPRGLAQEALTHFVVGGRLAAPKNFAALADLSGQWIDLVHGRPAKSLLLHTIHGKKRRRIMPPWRRLRADFLCRERRNG